MGTGEIEYRPTQPHSPVIMPSFSLSSCQQAFCLAMITTIAFLSEKKKKKKKGELNVDLTYENNL